MSALVYLNTRPRSIIHYDLKPANILFDRNGECKITVRRSERGWAGRGRVCGGAGVRGPERGAWRSQPRHCSLHGPLAPLQRRAHWHCNHPRSAAAAAPALCPPAPHRRTLG